MVKRVSILLLCLTLSAEGATSWPPKVNSPYPNVTLIDSTGTKVELSKFKGKVLLIEFIGMSCSACNAFAGGHETGGFGGVKPQPGMPSLEKIFEKFTKGIKLTDPRIEFIQIVLYNPKTEAPTPSDIAAWSKHFKLARSLNFHVLGAPQELLSIETISMVPAFHLVDKNFVLVRESSKRTSEAALYSDLLPHVSKLLAR